jgi:catechol 2,3-dioxygenase-like lactoylglutathione lyase family enzyme
MTKSLCLLCAGAAIALVASAFDTPAKKVEKAKPDVEFDGSAICALPVRDLAAAKKWYGDVLGFEVVYDLPEQGWCEMSTPAAKTMLGLVQDEKAVGNGGSTFALGVGDVARARAWLAGRKVDMKDVVVIPGVVELLYFSDPDGNRLMFYEPSEK